MGAYCTHYFIGSKSKHWTSLVAQGHPGTRGHGFEPGKIPHAAEQQSPCATATEPALEPSSHNY